MSEIAEVRHALETSERGELQIDQLCEADAPLVLPSRPFHLRGDGQGSTILRVPRGDAIVCTRAPVGGPTVIENLTIQTEGQGGDAIRIINTGGLDHSQRLRIQHVTIEPRYPFLWSFKRGIVLENVWNYTIDDVDIVGRYSDVSPSTLREASMEAGIDIIEGQEGCVTNARISCAQWGIRGRATQQGTGEGLYLAPQYIINVLHAIDLQGGLFGGVRTPLVTVRARHLFYCDTGVQISSYSGVTVDTVNVCASHLVDRYTGPGTEHPHWPFGVLIKDCTDVKVLGNRCWKTGAGLGYGLALLGCETAQIRNNTVDQSMTSLSLWLHGCRDVSYGQNKFQARQYDASGVIDQLGQDNSAA